MGAINKSQEHRTIGNLALPYKSYVHPQSTESMFVTGSQNLMTSPKGYAERRFGFSDTVESTPTTFNNLQRLFSWNRFDGTFIEMACDINASNDAVVYKRVVGQDASFISIFTDTGSSSPFDFLVSNNQVYFSNGHVAKKYNPVNGVSNWGIAIGSVNNATGPNGAGTGTNIFGGTWANPGNITANDGSVATVTVSNPGAGFGTSSPGFLSATNFGFAIPSTNSITGVQVEAKVQATASTGTSLIAELLINGSTIGLTRTVGPLPTSSSFVSFGGTSDLWGNSSLVPNTVNDSTFGVGLSATLTDVNGSVTYSIDFVRITVFGLGGPSITVSGSAGSFSATTGYQYVFCYGNSDSGHISSPSPVSSSTGAFTSKANVSVALTASTDPQVNQIHVFRSTDSVPAGALAGAYFEIPTSPFANTSTNITDNAADTALLVSSIAPIPTYNDPPTAFLQPTYFAGRVWGFKNNQVFFSGLEEISNGVPEESFPSGTAGNSWNFDEPVSALAVAGNGLNQTLMIFCPGKIYGITGNSLDTFRRFLISARRGCRSRTNVSTLGGLVAWIDTSTQVWGTDGTALREVGMDIRTDLKTIDQSTSSITFHTGGEAHWLCVSTGSQIFVADMDLEQWMPPWTVALNYIGSYEVSVGNYALMGATSTVALQLNQSGTVGKYNDNGTTYQPIANFGLKPLVPDYHTYSSAYAELSSEPTRTGWATGVQVDTNSNILANINGTQLSDVLACVDDDPTNTSTIYTSIIRNAVSPQVAYNRRQGQNLIQNIFTMNETAEGRFIGVKIKGQNADDNLRLYSMFVGIDRLGMR